MIAPLDLYIGRKKTGIGIRPDAVWPKMWRIHQGDRVSDMVNISRAKDAAISWALAGRGGLKQGEVVSWRMGEACPEAGSSASEQAACLLTTPNGDTP
jgi:hypothetical protein